MSHSLEQYWMNRTRFLTQTLILSGTLNIGLLSSIIYFNLKEEMATISYEVPFVEKSDFTNEQVLKSYSNASFQDLLIRLESKELLEDGYSKRDLALACLSAFHHFNVEKALGGALLQKRSVAFRSKEGDGIVELVAFVGLKDEHFEAILQYAQTEKWPLTPKGLFFEINRLIPPYDLSLLEAFYCTAEFHSLYSLVQKRIPDVAKPTLVDLLKEGTWDLVKRFSDKLRALQCYDVETFREFLTCCALEKRSKMALDVLTQHEMEYVLKRFDDEKLMVCLDVLGVEKLALPILLSSRSDDLRKKAARVLYEGVSEEMPQPYEYVQAVRRFSGEKPLVEEKAEIVVVSQPKEKQKKDAIHKIQAGESLWKISKRYGVSIESIIKANNLESDRLREGRELRIPSGN